MKPARPIKVGHAVAEISKHLCRLGFRLQHRSRNGSRYLCWPLTPFLLRVSNHRMKYQHKMAYGDNVLRSVIPKDTTTMTEIPALALEIAIRFMV